jgi:flagellar motor protein MotB
MFKTLQSNADIGDKTEQIELSTARATGVAEYLLSKDALTEGHYTVEGKGGEIPFSNDKSKEGITKNR